MFFCIPLVYGCPTSVVQNGSSTRVCPRCRNASVEPCKTKKTFEIPLGSKEIWYCNVCQWQAPITGPVQPLTIDGRPPAPWTDAGGKSRAVETQVGKDYVPPAGRGKPSHFQKK
ncbi:hypothetical protein RQP46_009858 [Phenoliferia psychrophenolica]